MNENELRDVAWIRALGASKALRPVRTAAGLTLQDAANNLNVSITTVLRWERGQTSPSSRLALAYANLLRSLGAFMEER